VRRTPALALGARRALGEMLQEQFLSQLKSRLREDDRLGLPSRIVNHPRSNSKFMTPQSMPFQARAPSWMVRDRSPSATSASFSTSSSSERVGGFMAGVPLWSA
jgi:hypothetical protein